MTHIHDEKEECCCGTEKEGTDCCCETENEGTDCGCGCGHDHDHDHEHHHTPVVTFENEDGTTEDHPIVDEFELDGNVYVLVMNQDETVTPLRVEGEEGDLVFLDEEEFNKVSEAYAELVEAEEDEEPLQ
jgi:hypothetical protein